jgi:hypothetical protein
MGCSMHSCDEVLEGDELPSLQQQLNGREPVDCRLQTRMW